MGLAAPRETDAADSREILLDLETLQSDSIH